MGHAYPRAQLYREEYVFKQKLRCKRQVHASVVCVLTCSTLALCCLRVVLDLVQKSRWTAHRAWCAFRHSVLTGWKALCRRSSGPRRQVTRMMPIGVPRVPYRTPREGGWQWVDIWNCLVRRPALSAVRVQVAAAPASHAGWAPYRLTLAGPAHILRGLCCRYSLTEVWQLAMPLGTAALHCPETLTAVRSIASASSSWARR